MAMDLSIIPDLGSRQTTWRISVRSMRLANGLLPRIIAEYNIARPAIELRVREGVHGAVLEDIRSGVADLGITFVDELPDTIAMVPLGREVFHAVTPWMFIVSKVNQVLSTSRTVRPGRCSNTSLGSKSS